MTAPGSSCRSQSKTAGRKYAHKGTISRSCAHHAPLRAEFDRAIGDVIDSGAFAGGPFVEKLSGFLRLQ